jgi:hypothetical protein
MMMNVYPFEANEARQMDIVADWQSGRVRRWFGPKDRLIGFDKSEQNPMHQVSPAFRGPGFGRERKMGIFEKGEPRFATFSPHPHPILAAL